MVATRLWTTQEYHQMKATGLLHPEERVELLAGKILQMSPKNPPHAATNLCVASLLNQKLAGKALVRVQDPIALSSFSEPEPDIAVVRWDEQFYAQRHPSPREVFLIIEIADTTLDYDCNQKAPVYAEAGIAEYWVLDVNQKQVHVFRQPESQSYQEKQRLEGNATLSVLAFPEVEITIDQLFPL